MKEENSKFDNWKTRLILLGLIVILWCGCWYLLVNNHYLNGFGERGQFGDMFGVVNSLFSGLAFGGIIYTILLQREELKLQRKELAETRKEFNEQNKTLRLQRFENTFFNLMNVHNQIVETLTYEFTTDVSGNFTVKGRIVFDRIFSELDRNHHFKRNFNELVKDDFIELSKEYKSIIQRHKDNLPRISYYFQSLLSLLQLIMDSELLSDTDKIKERKDRKSYFNIITSTQSEKEKSIIFYHIAFGWTVSQLNDYLSRLRVIEEKFQIYQECTTIFLTKANNYDMSLLQRYFEHFSV